MLWEALLAVAAVHAAPVVLIAQVIIAAGHRGGGVVKNVALSRAGGRGRVGLTSE